MWIIIYYTKLSLFSVHLKIEKVEYALKAGPDLLCFGSVGVFGVLLSEEKQKD